MQTTTFKGKVFKDDLVIEVEGCLDEATSYMAFARCNCQDEKIKELLLKIIKKLFSFGSDLLGYTKESIKEIDIKEIEATIDLYSEKVTKNNDFIIPGNNIASSSIHLARVNVRRLERVVVKYFREENITNDILLAYINRLSDLLFVIGKLVD